MEGMCCVDSCDRKQNCDESVLFHQFPKKGALKRTWLESIPMKKDIPRTLLVCSDHFLESDYKHVRGKKILNLDNTPTVFTKIFKDPDKNGDDTKIETDDEAPLKRKSKKHGDTTPTVFTKIFKDPDKNGDDTKIETDDEAPLKRKSKKHGDTTPTVFTKIFKDPDKNGDDTKIETDDEAPLKRKSKKHGDTTPTVFTKIFKDPDKNGDDTKIETDDEAPLKRKSKKHGDTTPTVFTKIFKDPDKNGDDTKIDTDDVAPLKRKSKKHGDTTPTKLKNPDRNDDNKLIESDDEVPLKRKTRKHGGNLPTFTKISKDPDKNNDDKVIESGDEVPLKRKSKRHVDNTFTKLSKDPHRNDYDKQEAEAHFKRKTRKRVIKVKKNRSVVKPSNSIKEDKSDSINKIDEKSVVNNQSNRNDNRISEGLTKNVNIEMNKGDFSEFDQKLDLEDNIPSFIIKDNKPRQMIEIDVPPCDVDVEVVPETTEVVNIEVSVDPSSLMMDEPSVVEEIELSDDSDIEITPIEKKCPPTDPVSLLTSSDEDEVVYLEPKYDMVEVSDETDEEDRPLIRFINKKLTEKPKYICSNCDYTTDTHSKYVRHLRKHTIFMCSVCSQTLKSKEQLSNHMRKHGLEKKYKCHLCSYKAKYQMSLILHVSTHKTYLRCKACPFMTLDRNILSRHRETHLQNKC